MDKTENIDISALSLGELQSLVKELNLYKQLTKSLGERGKQRFSQIQTGKKNFKIEYFSAVGEDSAYEEGKKVYKQVFDLDVKKEEITFKENPEILGGIRVFCDDKLVDLSYIKIERELSK